ncbi:MAG: dihydrofolate reductase [Anaerolineae bacterium]|nr:dihydrofolate reductase [Anaerolineae bacterium]
MGNVILDMAMSLDGIIAGPNDEYVGLHDWFFDPVGRNREIVDESLATTGALIMGRRTYDMAAEQDAFVDNPYNVPHVVLTHTVPKTVVKGSTPFIFVTDGIESALDQARAAAGDKHVVIGGGANIARQYLQSGLLDAIQIALVPIVVGKGIRLFDKIDASPIELETTRVIDAPGVTHFQFRVVKDNKRKSSAHEQ